MVELQSYLSGKWMRGSGGVATLSNPATEEPLGTACTEGLDFGAAVKFVREVGGPALRRMTFAERGELLRGMSRAIHAHRDELIEISISNGGNTRSDAKFDIDGASATLAVYADLGAEIGNTQILPDGDAIQVGRSARLFGQHIRLPRAGVAIHINAFNFPAWGFAEKAATALLAGMPVVSKPGTSTALLAHRIVQIVVEERLLPEGTLSFIAGNTGDLLDHLTGQDVVAFTGSGATGAMLRGRKSILSGAVRFNVEADSLNAAVLGPDVKAGSELLNLFVGDILRDITQKAGQKCTAIRRIYVPAGMLDDAIERLKERLREVRAGNPASDEVTMGPLATRQQLEDVRAGIRRLAECAEILIGDPVQVETTGVPPGKGYFMSPMLLRCMNPSPRDAVHNHEVFGPAATVMPYDGTALQAAQLVAFGGGGLVSSVYSDDREFLRETVRAVAPHHGRITVGTSKVASQAVPPGTVLPQLVHGGPGRAGGGEELGGVRGLEFYMQRVALQGDRPIVELLAGLRD